MPDLESDDFFNKEEKDASMNAEFPFETLATGSEEPETAAPETAAPETAAPETAAPETAAPEKAATTAKDEKPEIEAEPAANTDVKGLEKDSKDGESPKKTDSDQQSDDEDKENVKRHAQGLVDDTDAPQAKRAKPDEKEPETQTEVPADLA
ncbi:fruit protein pKIWI501-like [Drosophila subpulchrella]|uniref:fruit protein pKIWI501-like n=1 Tax=Drosophila subpulchrella TaxID=1486046 RepID=UPI0018A18403|nr:fruit protein pKIWI501-like [Drosophila subpulchrella]